MKPLLTPPPDGARELVGDGTWGECLRLFVDGEDLVARGVIATWFGGDSDPMDNGETASGVLTRGHPDLLGVALPLRRNRWTVGSPIPPGVPWQTMVQVYSHETGQVRQAPLIDLGPNKWTGHAIDLTVGLVRALGLSVSDGEYLVDFRIIGGAEWVVG